MAVIDDYVDSNLASGQKSSSKGALSPDDVRIITYEIAAADSDGSIYRLCTVTANEVPVAIRYGNDAITAGTDWDLGLYKKGAGGAVISKDFLVNGASLASAVTVLSSDGMAAVDIANYGKSFAELLVAASVTNADADYDLAWTANTVGSAAGTLTTIVRTK